MRINKFMSETGICSRREADAWIAAGRVTINNAPATLGSKVTANDVVCLDGQPLSVKRSPVYIAFNKPVGVVCTSEPFVKNNIIDFIKHKERIFPIGRLDKASEGLILLTNDGDIVNEVLRVENKHEKEYLVTVDKLLTADFLQALTQGVCILNTVTQPCRTERVSEKTFRIILTQGLNRQIRRMCAVFDFRVRRLQRVRIMHIELGTLRPGQWRDLTPAEINALRENKNGLA